MKNKNKPLPVGIIYSVLLCAVYLACLCEQIIAEVHQLNHDAPKEIVSGIYLWTDTCNVYILKSGENALLIDFGDGSVLAALRKIGVKKIDWILFTHHHREQCQGIGKADFGDYSPKIAVPEKEREFFEEPLKFRKIKVSLNDPYTVYGSSYLRVPIQPIKTEKTLKDSDTFQWHEYQIKCVHTPGNSPGAMTYLIKSQSNKLVAFSGDLILNGALMHNWFDSEWDYGFGEGIRTLLNSVQKLVDLNPDLILPSHSDIIEEPRQQLMLYRDKIKHAELLYLRGYDVSNSAPFQDKVSKPTSVTNIASVTPHIFKLKRDNFYPNFSLILSKTGKALVVDCGLLSESLLDTVLDGLKANYGLQKIDAVVITHMHGDHFLEVPYLIEKYGAQVWGLDIMAPVCERPEEFDYAAPIQAYSKKGVERIKFNRLFRDGEQFTWEEYKFSVDWMPGQTKFALCLNGFVDGKKIAFTGDNIFGDPDNPNHNGHEALVARNSAILEEGYIYAGEYLKKLDPDIIIGGHSFVMENPKELINRYRDWAYKMRDALKSLSSDEDYKYWFDPFWVRAEPYRLQIKQHSQNTLTIYVNNFINSQALVKICPRTPKGLNVEPKVIEISIPKRSSKTTSFTITADDSTTGVSIITFDITRNNKRYGELFDCIVNVEK